MTDGAPYGEGLIGRIDELESKLRATAIEVHRLRSCLRNIEGVGYVDHQSGNANFEYLQRLARSALNDAYTAPGGDEVERVARGVVQAVAELPDRSSPDDWPEAMLVTGEELHLIVCRALAAIAAMRPASGVFSIGDRVTKIKGSAWTGRVVGTYSTKLTPEGYAVESENEPGSVQIYPATALRQAGEG